jgi:hypothetical protein
VGRPRLATPEAELQAVMLARDLGIEEAARRTGYSTRSIKRWAIERGMISRKNPSGSGVQQLMTGWSYSLVFDSEETLREFQRFVAMCEAGWSEIPAEGDRVVEALRGMMQG